MDENDANKCGRIVIYYGRDADTYWFFLKNHGLLMQDVPYLRIGKSSKLSLMQISSPQAISALKSLRAVQGVRREIGLCQEALRVAMSRRFLSGRISEEEFLASFLSAFMAAFPWVEDVDLRPGSSDKCVKCGQCEVGMMR